MEDFWKPALINYALLNRYLSAWLITQTSFLTACLFRNVLIYGANSNSSSNLSLKGTIIQSLWSDDSLVGVSTCLWLLLSWQLHSAELVLHLLVMTWNMERRLKMKKRRMAQISNFTWLCLSNILSRSKLSFSGILIVKSTSLNQNSYNFSFEQCVKL